jgi:hypothetical protein
MQAETSISRVAFMSKNVSSTLGPNNAVRFTCIFQARSKNYLRWRLGWTATCRPEGVDGLVIIRVR